MAVCAIAAHRHAAALRTLARSTKSRPKTGKPAMLISVVIVTRNRPDSLRECMASVLAQDYPDMEIIIVDNASEPGVAERIVEQYPQVRLLRQEKNLGAAGGRNVGIFSAKGEICFSMDDDAILLAKDSLSRCVEYFQRDEKLAVLALRIVDQYNNIIVKLIPRRDRKDVRKDTEGANFSGTGLA
ncbi:MAG: glycosyltransferase family 2 protein [Proteobacteria bacterium]|nr:glycosyltransferase family 2 protein [Pseudomonadota bacterium]